MAVPLRRILLVDFNSFFASVEQHLNPHLQGRPVGIVPVQAETTCCIAASKEAKACGVRTGTLVREARRLCPGITFVVARHACYVDVHHQAVAIVDRIAPVREVLSIDEMSCELTGRWAQRERLESIAHQIKQAIRTRLGPCLTVSIGIGPNTLLAKLASDMIKPDGLVILHEEDIPGKFLHLPIGAISGIGRHMQARLHRAGIDTMHKLYAAPRQTLHNIWAGKAGDEMHDQLHGRDGPPRTANAHSLGHSHVLPPAMRNPADALAVLDRLTQKVGMRLRKQAFYATRMTVHVHGSRQPVRQAGDSRSTTIPETRNTRVLLAALHRLWHSGLQNFADPVHVGIVLHGLVPQHAHTPDWIEMTTDAPTGQQPRHHRLMDTLDQLNRKHGKNLIYFGGAHAALEHAPMRIAFNRIPDVETER